MINRWPARRCIMHGTAAAVIGLLPAVLPGLDGTREARCRAGDALQDALQGITDSVADASLSQRHTARVGMSARIYGLVVPGAPLRAKPITEDLSPLVLRITDTYPHCTAWRYDIEFIGLEPGTYCIADYVEREDGSPLGEVPRVDIEILSSLPEGQITPHALHPLNLPRFGGYRIWMIVWGIVWLAGLVWLVLAGYRKKRLAEAAGRRQSLADYLRQHLQAARDGKLAAGQYAELERMITAFWRRRMDLEQHDVASSIARIKADRIAGPLLSELERAMHDPSHRGQTDLAELLGPLESIPLDEVQATASPASRSR